MAIGQRQFVTSDKTVEIRDESRKADTPDLSRTPLETDYCALFPRRGEAGRRNEVRLLALQEHGALLLHLWFYRIGLRNNFGRSNPRATTEPIRGGNSIPDT